MIARITGTIVEQNEKAAIIETGGIGYLVYTPAAYSIGTITTMHTNMVIREDSQELYGFATAEERALFIILISVSSIGPKTGLAVLSMYPMSHVVSLIQHGDAKALALVPGIGKKTAEKVVIDLKDKLEAFVGLDAAHGGAASAQNDLVEALLSLGYRDQAIQSVVGTIDSTLPLASQIRQALQLIQGK